MTSPVLVGGATTRRGPGSGAQSVPTGTGRRRSRPTSTRPATVALPTARASHTALARLIAPHRVCGGRGWRVRRLRPYDVDHARGRDGQPGDSQRDQHPAAAAAVDGAGEDGAEERGEQRPEGGQG